MLGHDLCSVDPSASVSAAPPRCLFLAVAAPPLPSRSAGRAPPGGGTGTVATQGWIGAPAGQTTLRGLVPVTVAPGVTVASATVSYWPANAIGSAKTLATNASGGPGAALAVLDTTVLPNGSYVIDVNGTDGNGVQQDNEILVAVGGDYKPGREVVEVTDYTFPIAGLPITIGRRYDSLNKDKVGDFGNGWALTIGHPDLQVDQGNNVTITMPDGRRSTFIFEVQPAAVGAIILGFFGTPLYAPAPGVFGKLTSNGCGVLTFDPDNPHPICFESLFDPDQLQYAPTTYVYTDPYGAVYTMGADGTLKSIQDRNQNILTFASDGISSPATGKTVTLTRDDQGRITKVLSPSLGDVFNGHLEYDYAYDASGNLTTATRPAVSSTVNSWTYTYDGAHRLLTSSDPMGHPARTSTFDAAGRLATVTDALANVTSYVYDVAGHKTTTTYPDNGVVSQTFDDGGLAAVADRPTGPHDDTRLRRQPERNQAHRRARRGDDVHLRREREPDLHHERARREDDDDLQRVLGAADDHGPSRQHDHDCVRRPGAADQLYRQHGAAGDVRIVGARAANLRDGRRREHRLLELRRFWQPDEAHRSPWADDGIRPRRLRATDQHDDAAGRNVGLRK